MATNTAKRKAYLEKVETAMKGAVKPTVKESSYALDIIKALNYHNLHTSEKELRKTILSYVKKNNPKALEGVTKASDYEVRQIAILVTLLNQAQTLEEKELNFISTTIESLRQKYKKEDKPEVDKPAAVVISIEERIMGAARKHAAEIDGEIDGFVVNKSSTFSMKAYLLSNNVSGAVSKKIAEMYVPLLKELQLAVSGKDDQLKEGYSNFTKPQLKAFAAFVQGIISDCAQQVVTSKVSKPRVRKAKPAGVLVKNMKYQLKNDEYKLTSCNPADIIGATELWVFNTKYRRLTVYRANKGDTLSVRGTTILNFDLAASETKTLRKPMDFFKSCGTTKRPLNTAFNAIKTKSATPNGRVNEETIILRAF